MLTLLAGSAGLVAVLGAAWWLSRHEGQRVIAAWAPVAEELGATFERVRNPFSNAPCVIEREDRNALVRAQITGGRGAEPSIQTVVSALWVLRPGPTIELRSFAVDEMDELALGSPNGEKLTLRADEDDALETLRDLVRVGWTISSTIETISLRCAGMVVDQRELGDAIRLAGFLARREAWRFATVDELPDAELEPPRGPWHSRGRPRLFVMTSQGRVRITPEPRDARIAIEASLSMPTPRACSFSIHRDGTLDDRFDPEAVPGSAVETLKRQAPCQVVVSDGVAEVSLIGIERLDAQLVTDLVEALTEIGRNRTRRGAFR